MKRTLVSETSETQKGNVVLEGWVQTVRDHGKLTFFDLRDRTGVVQCIGQNLPKLSTESAIRVKGIVAERPPKLINPDIPTGKIEIQVESVDVLHQSEEMPFDMGMKELNLELPTLLDWRPLTLKHSREQSIFRLQAGVAAGFRAKAEALGCMEIFTPTIAASSTEGGSEVFSVKYYDHKAFLIQSPQLYKQMAVGAFERVYVMSHVYRAEPSVTTRHLSEVVQLDCELGFVNFSELLDALEFVGVGMISHAADAYPDVLSEFKIDHPKIPTKVPRLKLREAQQIIKDRTGRDVTEELDLNPEDEKEICAWALETHSSDFVTITHFPTKKRAFYTAPDPEDPEFSLSYDLLFRGIEISSGSQRIHDYQELTNAIVSRGMDPKEFEMYLMAFKYGMPPEGGFSFGLERITMKLLELDNVRRASLFPRDMERVDVRLSTLKK